MKKLWVKLNFSFDPDELQDSIIIDKRKDINLFETLCAYCADNNINLKNVSDDEFEGAVFILENFGKNDLELDYFYFSIDQ